MPLHGRLVLGGPLAESTEPLHCIGRNAVARPNARQFLRQRAAPMPAIADRKRQLVQVELLLQLLFPFVQLRQLALDHVSVAQEPRVNVHLRLQLIDLPDDLVALTGKLRHLARAAMRIDDAGPRGVQFAHDFDQ